MKDLSKKSRPDNAILHVACLAFLVLLIYGNTLNAPFQWDEEYHIENNPVVKDLHYFSHLPKARWSEQYTFIVRRYIPFLTFALNYHFNGLSVGGYHIVNIYCHLANTLLVYALVLLTFRTPFMRRASSVGRREDAGYIAFFSAAIFAAHPLQIEAVTYIMQRFASLAAFFCLLSLVAYIKSRLATDNRTTGSHPAKFSRSIFYGISLVSAILAMKTKENAFTFPFIIAAYEFFFFTPPSNCPPSELLSFRKERIRSLAPILLTTCIIPLTLISISGSFAMPESSHGSVYSQTDYLFTQCRVIVTYLRLFFFPVNQNFDYDYPVFHSFFNPNVLLSFIFLLFIFGTGIYLLRRAHRAKKESPDAERWTLYGLIGFGILWFFITLSVESVIPLWMLVNEYRVYLPSVGISIAVTAGAFRLRQKSASPWIKNGIPAMLVVIIAALSLATHLRNGIFGDKITLWEDTVKKSPAIAIAHNNLGKAYLALNMSEKAKEQFLIAVKLLPSFDMAHNNLGSAYMNLKMPDKALEQYQLAIKIKPGYADAHNNLGVYYQNNNMPDKAMEQFLLSIKLEPQNSAEARNNIGVYYQNNNMPDKAMEQFLLSIKMKPEIAEAHNNLGNSYRSLKMYKKAFQQYKISIGLKPDYAEAFYNIGTCYQTYNLFAKAIDYYLIAIRYKPSYQEAHLNLGYVYYRSGQKEKAQQEFRETLKLVPDNKTAQELLKKAAAGNQ